MTATAYIDRAGLLARISETDLEQRLAAPEGEAKLAQAISDANSTGDLYIGSRNPLPLATVTPALSNIVASIALYLFARATGGATKDETTAHDGALAVLKQISTGMILLGGSGELTVHTQQARIVSAARVMTRDALAGLL